MRCNSCAHENRESARFCEMCGSVLTAPANAAAAVANAFGEQAATAAERRQVTVLFSDVVGSTELSGRVDPEELLQLIRGYHELCAREIEARDGYLAQYLGDGVLAYFGYPVAHGEDAISAVRAGLGIVERVKAEGARQAARGKWELQVRVGIHTGVGIAEIGGSDRPDAVTVTGLTPNVASRVQGHAQPNSVMISADTFALVRGYFDCEPLGAQEIRGMAKPLELFRVEAASGARTRLDVVRPAELTPLVGRESELERLLAAWSRCREGVGQVVELVGEAGIGKSRLVEEVMRRAGDDGATVLELRCTPHTRHSALEPSIELLRRSFEIAADRPAGEQLERLRASLADIGVDGDEPLALLASLLSTPCDDAPLRRASPQSRRRQTIPLPGDFVP